MPDRDLPDERKISRAVRPVAIRQLAEIKKGVFRNGDHPPVRIFRRRSFELLDHEHVVVPDARRFSAPRPGDGKGKHVHVLSGKLYPVTPLHVGNVHRPRMDHAFAVFQAFARKRVGKDLEGRQRADGNVPFVHGFSVALAEISPFVLHPADLVKRSSASLAPLRRFADHRSEIDPLIGGI